MHASARLNRLEIVYYYRFLNICFSRTLQKSPVAAKDHFRPETGPNWFPRPAATNPTTHLANSGLSLFEYIRASFEWKVLQPTKRNRIALYYVMLTRVENRNEFFDRFIALQPKCMAVFGKTIEAIFSELSGARAHIIVAAQMMLTIFWEEPLSHQ
jgi:hypothetical protein